MKLIPCDEIVFWQLTILRQYFFPSSFPSSLRFQSSTHKMTNIHTYQRLIDPGLTRDCSMFCDPGVQSFRDADTRTPYTTSFRWQPETTRFSTINKQFDEESHSARANRVSFGLNEYATYLSQIVTYHIVSGNVVESGSVISRGTAPRVEYLLLHISV
jgi:uncharacterized surface protein with fasciclin (FAS1) repeats